MLAGRSDGVISPVATTSTDTAPAATAVSFRAIDNHCAPVQPLRAGFAGAKLPGCSPTSPATFRLPPLQDLSFPGRHPGALLPWLTVLAEDADLTSARHRKGLLEDKGDGQQGGRENR